MKQLLQIVLFILPLISAAQVDTVARYYTFGGTNNDAAEEIKATLDGGYIVIGSTSSYSAGNTDAYLLKVDSNCTYEWSRALGDSNNDWGYSVEQTHDKGYIIASTSNSYGNGGYDAVLMKRDSLGDFVWTRSYGGNDWDFVYDVVQTYDSGYAFCGETYNNSQGFSDVWVVKTNVYGDTLWTKTIGGALIDRANAIIETSDSSIVVAGITNTNTDSTQVYVLKFSNTGTLLWDSIYGDSLYENVNNIIEANNGDYVLNGSTTTFNSNVDLDFYMLRLNKDGLLQWERYYGSVGNEECFDLFEEPNGDFFNVGYTEASGGGMKDFMLFKVNSGGWWAGLGPTYGDGYDDVAHSVAIGNNGDICMAGFSYSFGNGLKDFLLVRLDTVILNPDVVVNNYVDTIPLNVLVTGNENLDDIKIFPNPATTVISVDINFDCQVNIINMLGQIKQSQRLFQGVNYLQIVNLDSGVYFLEIYNSRNQAKRYKIVIQ